MPRKHNKKFAQIRSWCYPLLAGSSKALMLTRYYDLEIRCECVLLLSEKNVRISDTCAMAKHAYSIDTKILARIRANGTGNIFTQADFLDLGSRDAVDQSLSRNSRAGIIRKIARGLYTYPRQHAQLGELSPSVDSIVKALSRRYAIRLQASGGYAANLLGISDQVPMRVVFLTDGPNRRSSVGKLQIILKRTTPRNMATAGKTSGLVIQALRHLGKRHVDDSVITILRNRLSAMDRKQLLKDLRYAPAWIAEILRKIAQPEAGYLRHALGQNRNGRPF